MLISYPIIPDHIDGFNAPEPQTAPHGFYPISKQNRWHGGIHLDPGTSADVFVRAIADGKLIAYRQASKPEFKSYDKDQTQPSDTSFVLLKHSTETGDGVNVEFYSLYMHLRNQADFPSSFLGRNRANYVKALCNPVWDTVKVFAEKDAPMIYRQESTTCTSKPSAPMSSSRRFSTTVNLNTKTLTKMGTRSCGVIPTI